MALRSRCALGSDFGGGAKVKRLVRWAQAVTGRVAATLIGGKSLKTILRGGNLNRWCRNRRPRGRPSEKDRLELQRGARVSNWSMACIVQASFCAWGAN